MTRLAVALTAPVTLLQARRLSRETPRLDPPPPPWEGVIGDGDPMRRVLVVGDSTAIGTGVARAEDGVAAQLARAVASDPGGTDSGTVSSGAVAWRAAGRNGATAAEIRHEILPDVLDDRADAVVILAGWNDALRLRSARSFAADLTALVREPAARGFAQGVPRRRIVVVAPPDFARFAVLPQPLRWALGAHAAGLRRAAARVCARWGAALVPGFDGADTATDRFHPNADGYAALAGRIAAALRR